MMSKAFRPEQFRCQEILRKYLSDVAYWLHPVILLEEEIQEWQSFGDVGGITLRGMPTLDLSIHFADGRKIGIQLDGDSHRGFRRIIDGQQELILNVKWGHITRIDKQFNPALWEGSDEDAEKQVIGHVKPLLELMKI